MPNIHTTAITDVNKGISAARQQRAYIYNNTMVINSAMPDMSANLKPIIFGDFSNYYVRNVQGIQVVRLNELYAANGQVGFMAFMRADGALVNAGTNPIKGLVMAAS